MKLCLKQMFCLHLQGNNSHSQQEMEGAGKNKVKLVKKN